MGPRSLSLSSCREKIDVEWKIPVAEMADKLCEFADEGLVKDRLENLDVSHTCWANSQQQTNRH